MSAYADRVKCESCKTGSGPDGCTDCLNTGRDFRAFSAGIDEALNDAYAEGRNDEREEWLPVLDALKWVMSATGEGIAGAFDEAQRVIAAADGKCNDSRKSPAEVGDTPC